MEHTICHFIPFHKDTYSIHTINFVFETNPSKDNRLKIESVYKMHFVCGGEGYIHTVGKITPLKKGDIFFTFPSTSFAIESTKDLTFMYISFTGLRGNMIFENLNISNTNFIFHNADEVYDVWQKGLLANSNVIDLMSESVLLYTFAYLGSRLLPPRKEAKQYHSFDQIKKYVDDHFSEHDFSLENICKDLSYNKKYISFLFKKHMKMGIIDYLNTIRIQNACTMMEQGFTSINNIADRCGYSDPQYFSKVFKSKMGITPSQHINKLQNLL